ncbi:MAG: hypothetical protein MUP53_01600, partial [Bacteroidales bacterium]|nr:hypothetical protein [Bacteroidales bacterium]
AEKLGIYDLPTNISDLPLYTRGVKALQIERDVLQKSEKGGDSDKDLIVLESQLANLSNINLDKVNITTLQTITTPPQKQNQKPRIIVTFGIIVGFMLADFMAFLRNFLQQAKK